MKKKKTARKGRITLLNKIETSARAIKWTTRTLADPEEPRARKLVNEESDSVKEPDSNTHTHTHTHIHIHTHTYPYIYSD